MIDTLSIRNNILRLGFSGKLTSQQDADERVSDMLFRINPKKDIVQTEKTPYVIPQTWSWVKLSDLYIINPKVEASETDEAAFIPMERISPGFSDIFTYEVQSWEKASKNHTKFRNGDVAFAKISPCFENRKSFIAKDLPNGIGGGTTELIVLRQPEMLPEYTYYLVIDQRFINAGAASYKGTVGQQRVQPDVIKNYLVPVPPFSEQKRIVKKVSEAFSILDEIDELQNQYASNQKALKSKLIDVAIQGKLTEQLPEDGTAEKLYEKIQEEKERLIKEGKIKKEKPLAEITAEEIGFEIPTNWKWIRLRNLGIFSGGKTPSMANKDYWENGVIPWVTSKDMKQKYIASSKMLISEQAAKEMTIFSPNTVLFVVRSGILRRMFPVAILTEKGTVNQDLKALELYVPEMCEYVYYVLKGFEPTILFRYTKDGTTVNNIVFDALLDMPVPLPPLAEQQRIAEKIDEVLSAINMAG